MQEKSIGPNKKRRNQTRERGGDASVRCSVELNPTNQTIMESTVQRITLQRCYREFKDILLRLNHPTYFTYPEVEKEKRAAK